MSTEGFWMIEFVRTTFLMLALQTAPAVTQIPALPIAGVDAEVFMRTAEVVKVEDLDSKGITKPRKVTLADGEQTIEAVFKTVDTIHQKVTLTTGRTVFRLRDSYRHEIAAYELDKLLGLGIVPPTVERKIRRETGSLSLWVHGAMTEWHRAKVAKIPPPDPQDWNDQMFVIRLFMQLTWDTDYNNISNLLIDADWHIWKIDSSRAFRTDPKLRREESLTRFSRRILATLGELSRERLDERLGPWLDRKQLDALWARRTRILELATERVAEHGETAVLYP
jgi:hypothetical protein